jgi:YbgC/YbaW family acyl-CoA thioester hydrolase
VSPPFAIVHRVRIDEVDAAGVVFFPRYFGWCHDAMAGLLESLEGGYASLLTRRSVGLPTVHAEADYVAPLRFGDDAGIALAVDAIGVSSCTMTFRISRIADSVRVATVRHVVVLTELPAMRSRPIDDDVRALFERHRATR